MPGDHLFLPRRRRRSRRRARLHLQGPRRRRPARRPRRRRWDPCRWAARSNDRKAGSRLRGARTRAPSLTIRSRRPRLAGVGCRRKGKAKKRCPRSPAVVRRRSSRQPVVPHPMHRGRSQRHRQARRRTRRRPRHPQMRRLPAVPTRQEPSLGPARRPEDRLARAHQARVRPDPPRAARPGDGAARHRPVRARRAPPRRAAARPVLRDSVVRRQAGDRNAPELRTKRRQVRRPERRRRGSRRPMAATSGQRNRPKISKSRCTRAHQKGEGLRKGSLLG